MPSICWVSSGHTIGAVLTFDKHGDIANFVSDDRHEPDDKRQVRLPWSTPVAHAADYDGVRLAAHAETH